MKVKPLHSDVLVHEMFFGEQKTEDGIIILDDDKTDRGIHPRWCKIYAVGHEQKDVIPGQWILVAHGRWSRRIEVPELMADGIILHKIDPKDILLVSNEKPDFSKSVFVSESIINGCKT